MIAALDVETAKAWGPIILAVVAVWHLFVLGRNKRIDHDAAVVLKEATDDAKQTAKVHRDLNAVIATRDATIERYDRKLDDINKELRAQAQRMGNLETEVATLKERNAELARLIEAKTQEIETLRNALTTERIDHQRTKDLLQQAIADKDEALMQQEVLNNEVERLEKIAKGIVK